MPSSQSNPSSPRGRLTHDQDHMNNTPQQSVHALSDVPEEATIAPSLSSGQSSPAPGSPYFNTTHHLATASTSTFHGHNGGGAGQSYINGANGPNTPSVSRKSSNMRSTSERLGRDTTGSNGSLRKQALASTSSSSLAPPRDSKRSASGSTEARHKVRVLPRLPHSESAEPAPTTGMYWSRGPVYGQLPSRPMRAHSVTLVDNIAWVFGGCDEKGCYRDIYCFDTETMQWTRPTMMGDIPLPCRAHTATLVDRKIVVFGGGQGPTYYDKTYVLDTITRRWKLAKIEGVIPAPRRAHTAVLYRNKIWVFGGGNGMQALNDVWTLDVGNGIDKMHWEKVETRGRKPGPRGYHTANLVGSVMVVVGGSDGRECFQDIWCLNLDTMVWSKVSLDVEHKRLAHSSTQVGSCLFVTGGHDGTSYVPDMLLFNLVSLQFETRPTYGKIPIARGYHASIVADGRMFLFGGFNGHDVVEDVQVLDLAGAAYLPQVMSFSIDV